MIVQFYRSVGRCPPSYARSRCHVRTNAKNPASLYARIPDLALIIFTTHVLLTHERLQRSPKPSLFAK